MEKNFRVLSSKEEQNLTLEERVKYFANLREYLLTRKLTNTTPGAEFFGPRLKKITNKIAKKVVELFAGKDVEIQYDGLENIPDQNCIFAFSHQGLLDNFAWLPSLSRHCFILHGQEVNKLLLLCQYNTGLILVKKGDKENNNNAKLDIIELLTKGHSLVYFPEGTWNLSPNKLHLPLSYGFLDAARKANVPVVPCAIEYTYDTSTDKEHITKIHIKYGEPIYIKETDNILDKLNEYEEKISTLRWELMEAKGITKREDVTNEDYINFLKGSYKNLKLGKLNLEKERENIFSAQDEFYQFFNINDVPFDENGNLIEEPINRVGKR